METSEAEKLEGRRRDCEDALEENNSCICLDHVTCCSIMNLAVYIPWLSRSFSTTAQVSTTLKCKYALSRQQLDRNIEISRLPCFVFQNPSYRFAGYLGTHNGLVGVWDFQNGRPHAVKKKMMN